MGENGLPGFGKLESMKDGDPGSIIRMDKEDSQKPVASAAAIDTNFPSQRLQTANVTGTGEEELLKDDTCGRSASASESESEIEVRVVSQHSAGQVFRGFQIMQQKQARCQIMAMTSAMSDYIADVSDNKWGLIFLSRFYSST